MAKVIQDCVREESCACYRRGKDILQQKIYEKIMTDDKYHPWYINEFERLGNYQSIRLALKVLVKKGYLIEYKAWPCYYKRKN